MEPEQFFANLEVVIGLCVAGGILCMGALIAGPLVFLLARRGRKLKQAAQAWLPTTGRVVESQTAVFRTYHWGFTLEQAEARLPVGSALPPAGPERVRAIVLGILSNPAGLVVPESTESRDGWPVVAYEYQVNGVTYLNNQISADEPGHVTTGGFGYSPMVVKRYPAGSSVTVYYNPQNPRQSTLER
jgi:hypothetical protein